MKIKFLKNAGTYRMGKSYNVENSAARTLLLIGAAVPDRSTEPVAASMEVPENRVMKPAPAKSVRRGRPRKNEYETKDLHVKND